MKMQTCFDDEISSEDMALLDSLDEDFRVCWDPSDVLDTVSFFYQ